MGAGVAGALAAAALAFVLHAFAAAIGLAVSSTAPTWRDASMALQLLSGLYLVFVAIVRWVSAAILPDACARRCRHRRRDRIPRWHPRAPGVGDRDSAHRADDMGGGQSLTRLAAPRAAGTIGRR